MKDNLEKRELKQMEWVSDLTTSDLIFSQSLCQVPEAAGKCFNHLLGLCLIWNSSLSPNLMIIIVIV